MTDGEASASGPTGISAWRDGRRRRVRLLALWLPDRMIPLSVAPPLRNEQFFGQPEADSRPIIKCIRDSGSGPT